MSPPGKRNGPGGHHPTETATAQITAATKPQDPTQVSAESTVVTITERRVTADVVVPDARAAVLLRRVVPGRGRETRDALRFVVFGSHLSRLVAPLQVAGYTVDVRTDTTRSA